MPEINFYQSIPALGIKGRFNTPEEFDSIGMPQSFAEKGHRKVLDIGCNIGAFMIEALKRGAGYVVGVDTDPNFTLLAERYLHELYPKPIRWSVRNQDAFDFLRGLIKRQKIFNTGYFNYIFCLSITHVCGGDPSELIQLCMRALYPKGVLILEINDRLQKEEVILPEGSVFYGKNKDNRTVYHITKV